PDIAIISFSYYPTFNTPNQALDTSRQQGMKINQYFANLGMEAKTSRITLGTAKDRSGAKKGGYEAVVKFTVEIRQLERLEMIMSGLVEIGITEINSTQFR